VETVKEAGRNIGFQGNISGAWRFVDRDFNGSISLKDLDRESFKLLASFKDWCEKSFGSIELAFKTLDANKTETLCLADLSRACKARGWPGDVKVLFRCLDISNDSVISFAELRFLETWQVVDSLEPVGHDHHRKRLRLEALTGGSQDGRPRIRNAMEPQLRLAAAGSLEPRPPNPLPPRGVLPPQDTRAGKDAEIKHIRRSLSYLRPRGFLESPSHQLQSRGTRVHRVRSLRALY